MDTAYFTTAGADVPIVAAAIHDGHALTPLAEKYIALDGSIRLREEDPFTARWTALTPWRIIGRQSRFEIDLNRAREQAVYRDSQAAWGLQTWKPETPEEVFEASWASYDNFYREVHELLSGLLARHGLIAVYDIHSYNHRREGSDGPFAPSEENPQVNIGTGTMERSWWAPVVDRFHRDLAACAVGGQRLDVRENVRFRGGYFPQWIHEQFPRRVCCLAIEVKKFFMDEWTGQPDHELIESIGTALRATVPGVIEELHHQRGRL